MKIEMGESLFYSWLRHVQACQIVQTNWKVSQNWELQHETEIESMMKVIDNHFKNKYGYNVFKRNVSHRQLLQQAECDAIGIKLNNSEIKTFAIDVAFHSSGLKYGNKSTTVEEIAKLRKHETLCIFQ